MVIFLEKLFIIFLIPLFKIKEKTLLKIALIASIVGIVILYFISGTIFIDEKTIEKINKDNVGEDVKLLGNVRGVVETDSVFFIDLIQPSSISVLVFKDGTNLTYLDGKDVEIIGSIDEYNGDIGVIADRIRVVE